MPTGTPRKHIITKHPEDGWPVSKQLGNLCPLLTPQGHFSEFAHNHWATLVLTTRRVNSEPSSHSPASVSTRSLPRAAYTHVVAIQPPMSIAIISGRTRRLKIPNPAYRRFKELKEREL